MDKKEYVQSDNFKIVCILQIFRELGELTGISFVYSVMSYRKRKGLYTPLTVLKFIGNTEMGVEVLDDEEVELYIKHIAQFYQFEPNLFSKVIREYAKKISPITIHETRSIQRRARVVYDIYQELKNENALLLEL